VSQIDQPPWHVERALGGDVGEPTLDRKQDIDEEPRADWSQQLAALRRHRVTLACLALILASFIWKAEFLGHYFYWQDDFQILDLSLRTHLSWGFLTTVDDGHLFPGVYLTAWLLARAALYNWLAGSAIVLAMSAAAGLAAWRALRTLLGNRPAILIPLVLYLLSPLGFPTDAWWITAVEAIPLQIALFMALDSHVRYLRTGKFRYAVASAGWQAFGLFFFEKSAVIPLLLFAVTAGFLTSPRLLAGLRTTITGLWKGWLLYLGLLAVYAAVFVTALGKSANGSVGPTAQAVRTFAWKEVSKTLLPGLLGGPWHWFRPPNYGSAFADPPAALSWAAIVATLVFVVASILTRQRAWRAWLLLAAWIVLADMVPIFIGRLKFAEFAALLGMETRYVVDAAAVLAIVVALAFWPVASQNSQPDGNATGRREFFTRRWRAVAIATVGVFAVGSVVSVQAFQTQTSASTVTSGQAYIANARAALAEVPAGTVIVSQHVPTALMGGSYNGDAVTSVVLGPLSKRGSKVSWTAQPTGTIDQLRVFGSDGRLWPAAIIGSTTVPMPFSKTCLKAKRRQLILRFGTPSVSWARVLRIGYVANQAAAGELIAVTYGSFTSHFTVIAGLQKVYFAVQGSATDVTLQARARSGDFCVAPAVAGDISAFPGSPIPAEPS